MTNFSRKSGQLFGSIISSKFYLSCKTPLHPKNNSYGLNHPKAINCYDLLTNNFYISSISLNSLLYPACLDDENCFRISLKNFEKECKLFLCQVNLPTFLGPEVAEYRTRVILQYIWRISNAKYRLDTPKTLSELLMVALFSVFWCFWSV